MFKHVSNFGSIINKICKNEPKALIGRRWQPVIVSFGLSTLHLTISLPFSSSIHVINALSNFPLDLISGLHPASYFVVKSIPRSLFIYAKKRATLLYCWDARTFLDKITAPFCWNISLEKVCVPPLEELLKLDNQIFSNVAKCLIIHMDHLCLFTSTSSPPPSSPLPVIYDGIWLPTSFGNKSLSVSKYSLIYSTSLPRAPDKIFFLESSISNGSFAFSSNISYFGFSVTSSSSSSSSSAASLDHFADFLLLPVIPPLKTFLLKLNLVILSFKSLFFLVFFNIAFLVFFNIYICKYIIDNTYISDSVAYTKQTMFKNF